MSRVSCPVPRIVGPDQFTDMVSALAGSRGKLFAKELSSRHAPVSVALPGVPAVPAPPRDDEDTRSVVAGVHVTQFSCGGRQIAHASLEVISGWPSQPHAACVHSKPSVEMRSFRHTSLANAYVRQ